MLISSYVQSTIDAGSIFNDVDYTANEMYKKFGKENVCNFAIGNPSLLAPQKFRDEVVKFVQNQENNFKYCNFAGIPEVRKKFAEVVGKQQGVNDISPDNVIMSCGASGALNVIFRTFLNQGDEVIINAPFFPSYIDYANIYYGKSIIVDSTADLDLDVDKIEKVITPKTKIIVLNSPNNPSGKIYPKSTLEKLAKTINKHDICVISDEPYREIAFGMEVPPVFQYFNNCIVVNSVSKDMSLPGVRLGWMVVSPKFNNNKDVIKALNYCHINMECHAPVIEQVAVANSIDFKSDLSLYKKKVYRMAEILKSCGYEVQMPEGTFYLFVKTPMDDIKFCKDVLSKNKIICLPGTPFGKSNYMRISCCCDDETIERSAEGFKLAFQEAKK